MKSFAVFFFLITCTFKSETDSIHPSKFSVAYLIHICPYLGLFELLCMAPKLEWEIINKESMRLFNRPQSSCCHEVLGGPNSEKEGDTLKKFSPNSTTFSEAELPSTGSSGMVGVLTAVTPQRASPLLVPARAVGFPNFISSLAFILRRLVFVQIWCVDNFMYFSSFLLCMC